MKIYTITTINTKRGGPHDTRCVGYMETYKDAEAEVLNNSLDIHEDSYKYVVIEATLPGIYAAHRTEWWFEWMRDVYIPCDKPKEYKSVVCFGIG